MAALQWRSEGHARPPHACTWHWQAIHPLPSASRPRHHRRVFFTLHALRCQPLRSQWPTCIVRSSLSRSGTTTLPSCATAWYTVCGTYCSTRACCWQALPGTLRLVGGLRGRWAGVTRSSRALPGCCCRRGRGCLERVVVLDSARLDGHLGWVRDPRNVALDLPIKIWPSKNYR